MELKAFMGWTDPGTFGRQRPGAAADRPQYLLPAILAGALVGGLYLSTLMWTITGCSAEYCADAGEFQVALPLWGTVHHTGYPLYMLLGSPFVAGLRLVGIAPASAASLFSLVWESAAVAGVAVLIEKLTNHAGLALVCAALFGVFEPIWVYGSLAKVYSLGMVITVVILALTIRLRRGWSDRIGWLLAFVAGLGVAHHRLVAVMLPAVGLYLLPNAWRSGRFGRWLAVSFICFLAGFLPYLDMPLRVWRGSTWNYGQAGTWNGFWYIFWGQEVAGQEQPLVRLPDLVAAALAVARSLAGIMTWPGLIGAVIVGALPLFPRSSRALATWLWGSLLSYLAFSTVFQHAVLLEAEVMAALLFFVLLAALGVSHLGRRGQFAATALMAAWALWLVHKNYPYVAGLTRDVSSLDYVQTVEGLEAAPGSVVMAPWGRRFFALSYAQRISAQLPRWIVVDHRADLAKLAASSGGIYTAADTPFDFGLDWWAARLGTPLRVTSAGPNMLLLTAQPLPAPRHAPVVIGDGIGLEGCGIRLAQQGQQLQVVLYWTAEHAVHTDYSTYVYASDRDAIVTPDDLVAQSDSNAPVYGWYPTTRWQPGEVVREDHLLPIPVARPVRTLFAGMYTRDTAGRFVQLGRVSLLHTPDGECAPQN